MTTPLDALPLETLRRRSSTKWATHPHDVLPLFVAETDFALAEPIERALAEALRIGDTGYVPPKTRYPEAFTTFAARRWGWQVDPARVRTTCDVMMAVAELIRAVAQPGEKVVITSPVYPPFFDVHEESRTQAVDVPLVRGDAGWSLDLDGIDRAFADGAVAILLCNPHNPTGTAHSRETLAELARIAERRGAIVISDEIHAPLAMPGATFTPFLQAAPEAEQVGVSVQSASKAFNLAGLKCAHMATASDRMTTIVQGIPMEVEWRTGLFGIQAGIAAFEEGDDWLDALVARLAANQTLLVDLLAEHVPGAAYQPGDAGFLAWVDMNALGWGDAPAQRILDEARVALVPGLSFGLAGAGFARINYGTGPEILTEAVERIGRLV
ncbi:MalY/PatB family protein [Microbacterium karelineae]|uniref:MalY/PatB family protein n=1 Tax=Microbacterium karelineae TaxID=2654283 RepID=UPI001E649354|nr:aminotransferase class I/II-fold pyridoxal phosphate-dependent enzyme [Microbacterium karelineae]